MLQAQLVITGATWGPTGAYWNQLVQLVILLVLTGATGNTGDTLVLQEILVQLVTSGPTGATLVSTGDIHGATGRYIGPTGINWYNGYYWCNWYNLVQLVLTGPLVLLESIGDNWYQHGTHWTDWCNWSITGSKYRSNYQKCNWYILVQQVQLGATGATGIGPTGDNWSYSVLQVQLVILDLLVIQVQLVLLVQLETTGIYWCNW